MNSYGRGGTCCLCYAEYEGWGHNPEPIVDYDAGRCCDECNDDRVIPARIEAARLWSDGYKKIRSNHPSNGRNQ